jgi:hypothetical protein
MQTLLGCKQRNPTYALGNEKGDNRNFNLPCAGIYLKKQADLCLCGGLRWFESDRRKQPVCVLFF